MKGVEVRCYSGHTYAVRPTSFVWQNAIYKVKAVEKEWREPGAKHFRVSTEDNKFFELCYNEQQDEWSVIDPGEKERGMKKIFEILEKDARVTPDQIATMTGMSEAEVKSIIEEAEKDRTIVKYRTMINWEKLGEEQVLALIEVRVQPQMDVGFNAIAERIYRFPEVRSAYLVSGGYDLAVLVSGKTMHEVAAFVTEKLATLHGVQGTVTHFLLRRYKEDGEILASGEEHRRLPLTM
jgi:DNA-binding Lrp family transcriptional regulator